MQLDGAEENTRFAFIPYYGYYTQKGEDTDLQWNEPYLYLDGKFFVNGRQYYEHIKFPSWKARLDKVKEGTVNIFRGFSSLTSNPVGCALSVGRYIFDDEKGDRTDAPNVVFCKY